MHGALKKKEKDFFPDKVCPLIFLRRNVSDPCTIAVMVKRQCKSPRTRTWSSSSVIKSGKEQVSSHFITTTIDKCCCVVGSNSCSAGLETEVARLREENSRAVMECDRLKEDNRKLAHDQSQLQDHTTKMTEELKSKFSKPLCPFLLPAVVWRNIVS